MPSATIKDKNYYIVKNKTINTGENFKNKFAQIIKSSKNDELLEFASDMIGVPDLIAKELSYRHYNSEYVDKKTSRFSYYNVLDTYILLKLN